MSTIAIVNNKGGVGKTTLACNLGHCLAEQGKKVLLVDMDSQCNASGTLLEGEADNTLYELYKEPDVKIEDCVIPSKYEKLSILTSAPELFVLESDFSARPDRGFMLLKQSLGKARDDYDVTILDCPPNLGMFAVQALACADLVIIPIECGSRYSIDGLKRIIETISEVSNQLNLKPKNVKILVNRLDRRTAISKLISHHIRKVFGERVFKTYIPINSSIQQAEMAGCSVIDYAPKSTGAFHYALLAKELLKEI